MLNKASFVCVFKRCVNNENLVKVNKSINMKFKEIEKILHKILWNEKR